MLLSSKNVNRNMNLVTPSLSLIIGYIKYTSYMILLSRRMILNSFSEYEKYKVMKRTEQCRWWLSMISFTAYLHDFRWIHYNNHNDTVAG